MNLWHGVPLKKIERDIAVQSHAGYASFYGTKLQRLARRVVAPSDFERYDYLLATNRYLTARFCSAFGVEPGTVIIEGYPRNDVLVGLAPNRMTATEQRTLLPLIEARRSGKRLVLYLPTHRDGAAEDSSLDALLALKKLDQVVKYANAVFAVRLHAGDRRRDIAEFTTANVIHLAADFDVYSLLPWIDVLVTDYSSVLFDFALTGRPVVFYAYDLASYISDVRGMYDAYEDVAYGPIVETGKEMVDALSEALGRRADDEPGRWANTRAYVIDRYNSSADCTAWGHKLTRTLEELPRPRR